MRTKATTANIVDGRLKKRCILVQFYVCLLKQRLQHFAGAQTFSQGQHCCGRNMSGPTMLRVVGQQFCVRLHGPLKLVSSFKKEIKEIVNVFLEREIC